jgi:hypothetical protein
MEIKERSEIYTQLKQIHLGKNDNVCDNTEIFLKEMGRDNVNF